MWIQTTDLPNLSVTGHIHCGDHFGDQEIHAEHLKLLSHRPYCLLPNFSLIMGLWGEIRRVEPKGAAFLRTLVVFLALIHFSGWILMLSGALGGWPPRLPGGGGIYTQAARRLVSTANEVKPPPPPAPERGVFQRSLENFFRIHREMAEAGTRAAEAAAEIAVELSFRIAAFSTGLVMILVGGWVRRKVMAWLFHLEMRATDASIRDMEKRIRRLERGSKSRGIHLGAE